MTRSAARELAIQLCFAADSGDRDPLELSELFFESEHYGSLKDENELFSEAPGEKELDYIRRLIGLEHEHLSEIDGYIERYAKGWRIDRISRTALAVLRCAVCEILFMDDIPNSAAINEAVELDKGYDEPDTVAFVNGVLGSFMRGEIERTGAEPAPAEQAAEAPK